jgi:hypothetical protein
MPVAPGVRPVEVGQSFRLSILFAVDVFIIPLFGKAVNH